MHKTRNLFRAKTAQKGFRVSVFARFLCASCYRVFVLQQPRVFLFIPRSAGGEQARPQALRFSRKLHRHLKKLPLRGSWTRSGLREFLYLQTRIFTDSHDRRCWNQSEYHIPLHAKGSLHPCTISKHHTRGGSAGKYNLPHSDNECTSVHTYSLFAPQNSQGLLPYWFRRK